MADDDARLPVLVIDGARFSDFDRFAREFSRLLRSHTWNGNLDAFNDLLRGGFGTPENGWVLRWLNSELSRAALGYEAATRRLEQLLLTCHRSNRSTIEARICRVQRLYGLSLRDTVSCCAGLAGFRPAVLPLGYPASVTTRKTPAPHRTENRS